MVYLDFEDFTLQVVYISIGIGKRSLKKYYFQFKK